MSRRHGPWADADRAWSRVADWHAAGHGGLPSPNDGDAALDAMSDIGTLRRVLDQVELAAVLTARRRCRSWAEIATRLGVSRQSAWERWRDVDEETATPSMQQDDDLAADVMGEMTTAEAKARRRRSTVTVPNVIGRSWDDAFKALMRAGLAAAGGDPEEPPHATAPGAVVVDQVPESGAKASPGSQVKLWFSGGRGGSAGVREPRRPSPTPKHDYESRGH